MPLKDYHLLLQLLIMCLCAHRMHVNKNAYAASYHIVVREMMNGLFCGGGGSSVQ